MEVVGDLDKSGFSGVLNVKLRLKQVKRKNWKQNAVSSFQEFYSKGK